MDEILDALKSAESGYELYQKFVYTNNSGFLEESIAAFREAVSQTSPTDANCPGYLIVLGIALGARFEWTDHRPDLDEAIATVWDALADIASERRDHSGGLVILGGLLLLRYKRFGSPDDLDKSIATTCRGIATVQDEDLASLAFLADALTARYQRIAQLADLEEAARLGAAAIDGLPADDFGTPVYLAAQSGRLQILFDRTRRTELLDEAVGLAERALAGDHADHPQRPDFLAQLGNALGERFRSGGDPADLDRAVIVSREALCSSGRPGRAGMLANFSNMLHDRHEISGNPADLDEAMLVLSEACTTVPADDPDRSDYLGKLGMTQLMRYRRDRSPEDLNAALEAFRAAAEVPAATPARRMIANWGIGQSAAEGGLWKESLTGYSTAIELLPEAAWLGLDEATRKHYLGQWGGMATEAATAATEAGEPELAVELLEAGRSVIWNQVLRLRLDLADLAVLSRKVGRGCVTTRSES